MSTKQKTVKTLSKAPTASLKSRAEVRAAITVAQNELVQAQRSHAARELANTARLRQLRIHIARLKTALNNQFASKEET